MRWHVVILALAGGVAACKRPAPAAADAPRAAVPDAGPFAEIIRVQQIVVEAAAWPEAAGPALDDRLLAGRAWEALSQSARFEAVGRRALPDGGPGVRRRRARLRAVYGVEALSAEGKRPGVLRGTAALTVDWIDDDEGAALWSSVACDADRPRDARSLPAAAADVVECAIGRAAHDLAQKEDLRHGDLAAVLAALDDPDPSVRQVAFATIGERHQAQALPRLVELLQSRDELQRDGAIGALVALRDPRAVRPLTELAKFRDLDLLRRIIDAVGAIGGEEARAYLDLIASGHEVPIIRELAQKALERLDRKADAGR
jgi:hypothetical protein